MGFYETLRKGTSEHQKFLAILIDPDKFIGSKTEVFLKQLPKETTHLFVGGSTVDEGATDAVVVALKQLSSLPIFLFPGDYTQITPEADALLFLSLLSGRNAEYLIGQQVKSIPILQQTQLEVIATGYLLLDGGNTSAVARVSATAPMAQQNIEAIVHTALAGQYMGAKLIYLEAGSGAITPVHPSVISEVKKAISLPLLVGGGIRSEQQKQEAYASGADMVVMGTYFENTIKI